MCFQAFADLSPVLQPLVDRVKENKDHWLEMSEMNATQNRKVIDGEDSRQ
jgi:hypothetical protein